MGIRARILLPTLALLVTVAPASTQINFPKSVHYAALGDSVAAGEGAMPVTAGYAYQLYDHGVFGQKQETDFAILAGRGTRSWDLRDRQVPQLLCATSALRPTVVTTTAGANDFLAGDVDVPAIAGRVAEAVHLLLNNDSGLVSSPVLDPVTGLPCPALENVTILVSNYYRHQQVGTVSGPRQRDLHQLLRCRPPHGLPFSEDTSYFARNQTLCARPSGRLLDWIGHG